MPTAANPTTAGEGDEQVTNINQPPEASGVSEQVQSSGDSPQPASATDSSPVGEGKGQDEKDTIKQLQGEPSSLQVPRAENGQGNAENR